MPRPWLWGLTLGLLIGACVVALSTARYGFSAQLLLLGIVLAIGFGGFAFIAPVAGGRRTVD
jgi:hypothetical protein